jgi:aspartate ammonia-lyase
MPPQQSRVEHDTLGPLTIPHSALWGVRTARCVANLSFSGRQLGSCAPLLRALACVKRAAATANGDAGLLAPEIAGAIERAARRIEAGELAEHFPVDLLGGGGSIGLNINIDEVIANIANESLGGQRGTYAPIDPLRDVNASQSTADVCHSAARIALLSEWPHLEAALAATVTAFDEIVERVGDTPTLSRTCLRDALSTTAATLFRGQRALLARRARALQPAIEPLHRISLGGTVIGDGSGAPPAYRATVVELLAGITRLPLRRAAEAADALQNSDDLAAVSSELAHLAQAMLKIAQDLRLLSSGPSGGLAEVELPRVQEGSSFFAGKSNPVIPETLMQCAFQILGCDRAAQEAARSAELHLDVFDGAAAVNVLDAMTMATRALTVFESSCLRGLDVDAERCRALAATAMRQGRQP